MDNLIEETEKELKELKQELVSCANAIKTCTDKDQRQKLFDEKKEIQFDISEVEADLQKLIELRDNPVAEGSTEETTDNSEVTGDDVTEQVSNENKDTETVEQVEQSENEEEE